MRASKKKTANLRAHNNLGRPLLSCHPSRANKYMRKKKEEQAREDDDRNIAAQPPVKIREKKRKMRLSRGCQGGAIKNNKKPRNMGAAVKAHHTISDKEKPIEEERRDRDEPPTGRFHASSLCPRSVRFFLCAGKTGIDRLSEEDFPEIPKLNAISWLLLSEFWDLLSRAAHQ